MFHENSPGVRRAAPNCCLVAPTGPGLTPEIVHHAIAVATTLTPRGWRVTLLLCGPVDRGLEDRLAADGVECRWLDDLRCPAPLTLGGPHLFPALHDSDRVRAALQLLHEQQPFTLIVFPERGGLGFRSIQAKQTGQAFADVLLAVTLHGPGPALRHVYQQWLNRPEDLALDHAERYAFEHADVQWSAHAQWLAAVERLGWRLQPDAGELPTDRAALAEFVMQAAGMQLGYRNPACKTPETIAQAPLVTIVVPYFNLPDCVDEMLASLEQQTYPHLEVLVINDGSTDPAANRVFDELRGKYPQFDFLHQENQGIGATRNRGLLEARGDLFLPVDADNIAHPDMVRRFVRAMQHNPQAAAVTCYFLAFREAADLAAGRFAYAYKPTGGPRVLGCLQNVYGDGNAMFRTAALRDLGGFSAERDTSFEDWEVFVRLVSAGQRVEVLPDFLFYYRHRAAGFSRNTSIYRNHQRVLRRYVEIEQFSEEERTALWNLLAGYQYRLWELEDTNRTLATRLASRRYRLADKARTVLGALYRQTIGRIPS